MLVCYCTTLDVKSGIFFVQNGDSGFVIRNILPGDVFHGLT